MDRSVAKSGCVEMVSVIVNVYNCREYLPTSLESVRLQTYNNLEVILVDDCSTDGSGEYCEEFSKQDDRFRVIHHTQNTGVSGPRNTGLREAKGEYIYFMDSDDYLHERAIEKLVWALEKTGLELAVFDFARTNSLTEDTHRPLQNLEPELVSSEQMIFEMLAYENLRWCVVWNKLYKRSLIGNQLFNHYYSIQDQDFNIRIYKKIKTAAFVPEVLYWYYQNPNSLQRDKSLVPKKYYFNTLYRFRMLDYLSKNENEKKYRTWIIDYGYRQMLKRRDIVRGTEYEQLYAKATKEILRNTIWVFLKSNEMKFKKRARFLFYWYSPRIAHFYVRLKCGGQE